MCPMTQMVRGDERLEERPSLQAFMLSDSDTNANDTDSDGPGLPRLLHLISVGHIGRAAQGTQGSETSDIVSEAGQDSADSGRSTPDSTDTAITEVIDRESEAALSSGEDGQPMDQGSSESEASQVRNPGSTYEVIGLNSGCGSGGGGTSVSNSGMGYQTPPAEGVIDLEGMHLYRRNIIAAPQAAILIPASHVHRQFQPYPIALPPTFHNHQGPIPMQVPMPMPLNQPQPQGYLQYGQAGHPQGMGLLVQHNRRFTTIQQPIIPQQFQPFASIPTSYVEPRPISIYETPAVYYTNNAGTNFSSGCDIQVPQQQPPQQGFGTSSSMHIMGPPPPLVPVSFEMNNAPSNQGLDAFKSNNCFENYEVASSSGQGSYWSANGENQSQPFHASQLPILYRRIDEGNVNAGVEVPNSAGSQASSMFEEYPGEMQQSYNGTQGDISSDGSSFGSPVVSTTSTSFESISSASYGTRSSDYDTDYSAESSSVGQPRSNVIQNVLTSNAALGKRSEGPGSKSNGRQLKYQRNCGRPRQNDAIPSVTYIIDCGTTFYMNGQELPYVINAWDPNLSSKMSQKPPKNYEYYVPPTMDDGDFFGGQQAMFQMKMMQYFGKCRPDIWRMQAVPDFQRSPTESWISFNITAKLRFCCRNCNIPWTSKKGKVVFAFTLDSPSRRGWILMKMFGQVCMRKECKDWNFQTPACYPEEIDRAIYKLFEFVSYVYYGIPLDPLIFAECEKSIRVGFPKSRHRKELCQACQQGICQAAQ